MNLMRPNSFFVCAGIAVGVSFGSVAQIGAGGPDIWPSVTNPVSIHLTIDKVLTYPQLAQAYRDTGSGTAESIMAYWRPTSQQFVYQLVVQTVFSNAQAGTGANSAPVVTFGPVTVVDTVSVLRTGPVDIALDGNENAHVAYMFAAGDYETDEDVFIRFASEAGGWAESDIPLPTGPFKNRMSDAVLKMSLDLEMNGVLPTMFVGFSDEVGDFPEPIFDETVNAFVFRFHKDSVNGSWIDTQIDTWAGPMDFVTNAQVVSHAVTTSGTAVAAFIKTLGVNQDAEIWIWDEANGLSLVSSGEPAEFLFLQLVKNGSSLTLAFDGINPATSDLEIWIADLENSGFGFNLGPPSLVKAMPSNVQKGASSVSTVDLGLEQLLVDPNPNGRAMIVATMPVEGDNEVHADPFLLTPSSPEWDEEELRPLSGSSGQIDPDGILEETRVLTAAVHKNSGRPLIVDVTDNLLRWSRGPSLMLHAIESPDLGCVCSSRFTQGGNVFRPIDNVGTFYTFDSLPPGPGTYAFDCVNMETGGASIIRNNLIHVHHDVECGEEPKEDCGLLVGEAGIGFGWNRALLPLLPALIALAGWVVVRKRWS